MCRTASECQCISFKRILGFPTDAHVNRVSPILGIEKMLKNATIVFVVVCPSPRTSDLPTFDFCAPSYNLHGVLFVHVLIHLSRISVAFTKPSIFSFLFSLSYALAVLFFASLILRIPRKRASFLSLASPSSEHVVSTLLHFNPGALSRL